jgi:hypothetical protein
MTPSLHEPQIYTLSVAPQIEPHVSNVILEGQEPLLHTSAVITLGAECQVSIGNSSMYSAYRKLFHGSTGKSFRDQLEKVRYLLETVQVHI